MGNCVIALRKASMDASERDSASFFHFSLSCTRLFSRINDAISDFLATHPTQKLGLNSLYRAMQTICKESGYSRRDFDAARQEYLRIQEEEAA